MLVPVYNHAPFVRAALASVWEQPGVRLEIIAVNDGSTDLSGRVLDELKPTCPVSLTVVHQSNAGVCAALKRALELAAGEYLCVLASDDQRIPGSLARQAKEISAAAPEVVGVFGDVSTLGAPREDVICARPPDGLHLRHEDLLFWRGGMYLQSGLFRTQAVRRAGGFDETLSFEDWDLLLRLARAGTLKYFPGAVARYRRGVGGLSTAARRHESSFLRVARRESEGLPVPERKLAETLVWQHLMNQAYANLDLSYARKCALKSLWLGTRTTRARAIRVMLKSLVGHRALTRIRSMKA